MFYPGTLHAMPNSALKRSSSQTDARRYIAFVGARRVGEGEIAAIARAAQRADAGGTSGPLLIFDVVTSEPLELDLRGNESEMLARLEEAMAVARGSTLPDDDSDDTSRGPGRPRLGVVGREVTLLPRHWEWLNAQPGGASAAIRRVVDLARAANAGRDRRRRAQEYAYRFLVAMLGDAPGFEEATRALFANDAARFTALSEPWPSDPRDHARRLAAPAWSATDS